MSVNSNSQYIVFVGGEPQENGTQHDSLSEAMAAALSMAEEQAEIAGIDVDDIDIYDNADDERGACPVDSDGAYWPVVRELS